MLRAVGRLQHGGKFGEVEIAAAGAADFAAEVGEGFEAEAGDAAGFDGGFYDVARADGVAGAGGERAVCVGRANAFFVLAVLHFQIELVPPRGVVVTPRLSVHRPPPHRMNDRHTVRQCRRARK